MRLNPDLELQELFEADSEAGLMVVETGAESTNFDHVRRMVAKTSSITPSYAQSSNMIKSVTDSLDCVDSVKLHPHQVTGVAWLTAISESTIGSALLRNDTGLGKAISALATIFVLNMRKKLRINIKQKYRPVRLVCLTAAI